MPVDVATFQPAPFQRLFIALAVPPEVRQAIKRAQGQLQRCAPRGLISWTRPEQFHVTLKFLGDVPTTDLNALEQAIAAGCVRSPALELAARGLGFFPNRRRPHIIWVGADDMHTRLVDLHRQIDEAVRPFAPAEPHGRFTGHITLGRFKPGRSGSLERLMEKATRLEQHSFGTWPATEIELVRSELTSEGAVHDPIRRYRLGGGNKNGASEGI